MEIVKLNPVGIKKAVTVLKQGGVVVFPTDTAYGMGGIYNSQRVINKILKIKRRKDKKFTLVASSLSQVEKNFKFSSVQKKLAKKFWPGALSIVVTKNYSVRVPKNKLAQNLAQKIGKPLIATSANLAGGQTLYDAQKIIELYQNKKHQPDLIIDAGKLSTKKTSTIVQVNKKSIKILRQGNVKMNNQN